MSCLRFRERFTRAKVLASLDLSCARDGQRLRVDGLLAVRQSPRRQTPDAYTRGAMLQAISVAKAKSGRPQVRLIKIPKL